MPLKLKRRPDRPHWYIHGTVRGITIRESTGVTDQKAAEAIKARREWEIIQRSVFGAEATATFIGAAVKYMEADGERLYLKPIIASIGSMPLAKIDQGLIDKMAKELYPEGSPATLNRSRLPADHPPPSRRGGWTSRPAPRPAASAGPNPLADI
jgi:hypothetical protein